MRKTLVTALTLLLGMASAAVSQQIRMTRPAKGDGPTEVRVALLLVELMEIDDVDESFELDFFLRAQWKDDRLAWEQEADSQTSRLIYEMDKIWHPRFTLVNEKGIVRKLPEELAVAPDGSVTYLQRFQGRLAAVLALEDFPSDRQNLPIRIVTGNHSPDEVKLVIDKKVTGMLDTTVLASWRISSSEPVVDTLRIVLADKAFAQVTFYIAAEREVGYYLWTMMLPLTFIVLMAWTVFWIDPKFLPSQVGVSTASVFSMMAYRTALRLALPKVSYMTKADVFILGCTVLVFSALAHAISTGRLAKTGHEDLARLMDKWARWVYPGLFGGILWLAIWW